jgi:hypothetical protein
MSSDQANGDTQYDLLTAALLGAAVGAGLAALATSGRRKPHLSAALVAAMQPGRKAAMKMGSRMLHRGAKAARDLGEDTTDSVRRYAEAAREAIDEAVAREVRDLRRAVRRRRKRLGI